MIRTVLEKNIQSQTLSFIVNELNDPYFDPNWHFHSHYQLFTVLEGMGTRFIGDSIKHFEKGDTVFLGPNIPHLWHSDKAYFEPHSGLKTRGIVVYFTKDFLGESFFDKTEMTAINHFLSKGDRGLVFIGDSRNYLVNALQDLVKKEGFERILGLLKIFHELAKQTEYEPITRFGYINTHKISETERMQKVHEYVLKNYKTNIFLEDVAEVVNMSKTAFCRYFKKRANKTFSDFVNEFRVGQACKLLGNEKLSIVQISYDCGFNTLSNFNRQFKFKTGKTPSEYQREIWNAL